MQVLKIHGPNDWIWVISFQMRMKEKEENSKKTKNKKKSVLDILEEDRRVTRWGLNQEDSLLFFVAGNLSYKES